MQCHIIHGWPLPTYLSCSCMHEQKAHGAEWVQSINHRHAERIMLDLYHLWAMLSQQKPVFHWCLPISGTYNTQITRSRDLAIFMQMTIDIQTNYFTPCAYTRDNYIWGLVQFHPFLEYGSVQLFPKNALKLMITYIKLIIVMCFIHSCQVFERRAQDK